MKKYIVFVMILGLIAVGAPTKNAQAVTLSDLQTQIKNLTSQVSSIASQLTGQAINSSATTFCLADGKVGDVNGTHSINAVDAMLVTKMAAGTIPVTPSNIYCADANGDGSITTVDATMIANYFAHLTPTGNVGGNYTTGSGPSAPATNSCLTVGDVDCSGGINAVDAMLVSKVVAGTNPVPSPSDKCRYDSNGDGTITPGDATMIANYFTSLTPTGNVGQNCPTPPTLPACVDTGTTQSSRWYTFSEINPNTATSGIVTAGQPVNMGEFRINVGPSTICGLYGVQIVSLNNPNSVISSVKIVDMDTNSVLATSNNVFAQLFDSMYYLSVYFPVGTYPLVANSTHQWKLVATTNSGIQNPFLLGLGIGGVHHTAVPNMPPNVSSQAIPFGIPIFQKVIRIMN